MPAAYVELYMDQGTSFRNIINLMDDTINSNINIDGYIISSQMRRSYYSANASANLVCTITDAPNGEITMTLSANNTANLKAGRYLFDVNTIDNSNNVSRVLEGIITVNPRIAR